MSTNPACLAPLIVGEISGTIETLRQTGVTIVLVEQNARRAARWPTTATCWRMGEIALHGPGRRTGQ